MVASSANVTKILFYAPSVLHGDMAMQARDRRVAIIGVVCLLLSISLGAAFASGPLEAPGNLLPDFIVGWSTSTRTQSEQGLNDQVVTFDIREHNITSLTVRLTWTDDELVGPLGRRDDLLTLRVEGPSALDEPPEEVSGTTGELVLTFDLASVPTDDEAKNLGDYDFTNATGDWSITVSVSPRGLRDSGNDWTVTVSYAYYVGRLIQNPGVV